MSRSNPTESSPNPATSWLEWKGEAGELAYWDKQEQKRVAVPLPFTFLLLDRLGTVRGYSKNMQSGIYANEVRDTRMQPLVVKYFKGGKVAEGLWEQIKPIVKTAGGKFCSTCYIAAKAGKELVIAGLQLTGCALGPWFEFEKKHRKKVEGADGKKVQELYAKAIVISKGKLQKSGKTEFYPPMFTVKDVTTETDEAARKLDEEVQAFLDEYFRRNTSERAEPQDASEAPQPDAPQEPPFEQSDPDPEPPADDYPDVPF